jgi:hypothetical protein
MIKTVCWLLFRGSYGVIMDRIDVYNGHLSGDFGIEIDFRRDLMDLGLSWTEAVVVLVIVMLFG